MAGPYLVADQELIQRVRGDGSPHFTLLTVMTKFLFLGMPLADVIRAVTIRPAELIGMADQVGSLRPGAIADVAILEIARGAHELFDIHGLRRTTQERFVCTETIRAGRPMTRKEMPAPPPWIRLVDLEPHGATAAG